VEYTDTTFTTEIQKELGVGTLTLGASLTASTLARTTLLWTGTTLNGTSAYAVAGNASAITIGTAANVLIFIGPDDTNTPMWSAYSDTLGDNLGINPLASIGSLGQSAVANGDDYYQWFEWRTPMLVKRATIRVGTAYAGTTGTPISTVYARIYAVGTNGRPSKLLYDFGTFGTNPLNGTGNISSGASGNGYFLTAGEYFFDIAIAFSGATGSITNPQLAQISVVADARGRMGTTSMTQNYQALATGATAGAAPDPANVTGYARSNLGYFPFALKAS
jgi:hypothetical protein